MGRHISSIIRGALCSPFCLLLLACIQSGRGEDEKANTPSTTPSPVETPSIATKMDIVHTPFWDLIFSEGETVSIDCGVFTNGNPQSVKMVWLNGSMAELKSNDRITLTDNFSKTTAYSVLTLTISDLKVSDTQNYTCQVQDKKTGAKQTVSNSLSVWSKDSTGYWCGFEREDMCGWTSNSHWHMHNSTDKAILDRSRGPRFDHTYGALKHIGHFIDVDLEHGNTTKPNSTAVLISPKFKASTENMCLHFWYVMDGNDQDKLVLYLEAEGTDNSVPLKNLTEHQGPQWIHQAVDIAPQTSLFRLKFKATTCINKCEKAAFALDDISLENGKCEESKLHSSQSQPLKVRLVDGKATKDGKPTEGRVEVLHDGQYGTLCSRQFGDKEAKVVCKSLGFEDATKATKTRKPTFGAAPPKSKIWLKKLQCDGNEDDLALCIAKNETWDDTEDCSHDEDAGVICYPEITVTTKVSPLAAQKTATSPATAKASTTVSMEPTTPPSTTTSLQPTTTATTNTTTTTTTTTTLMPTKPPTTTTTTTTASTTPKVTKTTSSLKIVSNPSTTVTQTSTSEATQANMTNEDQKKTVTNAGKIGRGVVAGIVVIVLLGVLVFAVLIYKGRKRRMRKSKYLNFGSASYSREHLPTNEFHLESPLTMSSMGYTVLA